MTVLAPGPVRETLPVEHEQSLVEKLIPDFLWISTEYTAKMSLDALERNKMRVVPGVTSKAMSVASGYAPRAIVTPDRRRGLQEARRRLTSRETEFQHPCTRNFGAGIPFRE